MSVGCYIYHRWDILWLSFKGVRGGLAFPKTPRIPPPPPYIRLCHHAIWWTTMRVGWRTGVWRNEEEVQIVRWGLEYLEKAWIQACSWKIVKKRNAVQERRKAKLAHECGWPRKFFRLFVSRHAIAYLVEYCIQIIYTNK